MAKRTPQIYLETETGKVIWQCDILKHFEAENIDWGLSASPLVEGDHVLAIPGGKGAGVAAFDKATGKVAWKTGDDRAAYASPIAVTVGGERQAVSVRLGHRQGGSPRHRHQPTLHRQQPARSPHAHRADLGDLEVTLRACLQESLRRRAAEHTSY